MLAKRSDDIEKRNPKPKPVNNILHISTYTNYPSFSSSNIKFQNYHEKCHLKLKIKTSSIQKYDINVYFEFRIFLCEHFMTFKSQFGVGKQDLT